MATRTSSRPTMAIQRGRAAGQWRRVPFSAATYYPVGAGSIFATAADINGDDRVDLTAVTGNGLSVLLSGQSGDGIQGQRRCERMQNATPSPLPTAATGTMRGASRPSKP